MQLSAAERLARTLIAEHGLSGWSFTFNRAKRSLGLCRYGQRRIELSAWFVVRNEEPAIRDVVLHEIAHALAGPSAGHGPAWRKFCLKIGAVPERCGKAAMPAGSWRAECPGCKGEFNRHRRPRRSFIYSCGKCGAEQGRLLFRKALRQVPPAVNL